MDTEPQIQRIFRSWLTIQVLRPASTVQESRVTNWLVGLCRVSGSKRCNMQRAFGIGTGVKRGYAVDLQSDMGGRKGCSMLAGMDADLHLNESL